MVRIITWNLKHIKSKNSWDYAFENLNPDICFFQECFHPLTYLSNVQHDQIKDNYVWEPTRNGWGIFIYAKNIAIKQIFFSQVFKGRLIVGSCKINNSDMTLIGMHVPVTNNYSRYNLQDMFIEVNEFLQQGNCIIGGDLNFGECFDRKRNSEHKDILHNILSTNNLVNCYRSIHDKEEQTFRPNRNPASNIHIDYILASDRLAEKIKHCEIICNRDIELLSDHNPVMLELF